MTENDPETLATLRASLTDLASLINHMALDGDTEHSDLYVNVLEDRVEVLQSAPGDVVLSFGTFDADYFTGLDLHTSESTVEAVDTQGNDIEVTVGAEAIWNVQDTLTYLNFAGDATDTIELGLTGDDDDRLAEHIRATGPVLNTWTRLPGSTKSLESVPFWLPSRFDDEERYTNPAGDPAPTTAELSVDNLTRIIRLVQEDDTAEYYPVTVEGDELVIDVGDDSGSGARGTLPTYGVSGPPVSNTYYDGFEEVISVLDGRVELQTAPSNNPLALVRDRSNYTVRHVIGSVEA